MIYDGTYKVGLVNEFKQMQYSTHMGTYIILYITIKMYQILVYNKVVGLLVCFASV